MACDWPMAEEFWGERGRCLRKWGCEQLKGGTEWSCGRLCQAGTATTLITFFYLPRVLSAFTVNFLQVQTSSSKSESVFISSQNNITIYYYCSQILIY